MKAAFATCVQLGLSCIEEIYRLGGKLDLLITLQDEKSRDKSGRIYLDELAARHDTPLLKIEHINEPAVIAALKNYAIDWLLIIGWSQIAGRELLATPTYGCIGMHPTLLPIGRGRASIPWAILKGLKETGVTMFKLDAGVDTGDIIAQGVISLDEQTTATELYRQVETMHMTLVGGHWPDIMSNQITLTRQCEAEANVWPGRKPEDGEIFSSMTMAEADKLVRAVTRPYPGAFYRFEGRVVRIWAARVQSMCAGEPNAIKLADGYLVPVDYEVEG